MKFAPPWPEELSQAERKLIEDGRAKELPEHVDLAVVGGGMLGLCTTRALAEARLGSVVVLEKSSLASGPSGRAAGLLIPEAHYGLDSPALVELGRQGLKGWRALEADLPQGVGLSEIDLYLLQQAGTTNTVGSVASLSTPEALPPGAEWLGEDEVARLAPRLAEPTAAVRVRQARLNPLLAAARIASALPGDVSLATGVDATGAVTSNGRIVALSTSSGSVAPGAVIFATGLPPALTGIDLRVPSQQVKGHLVLTEPCGVTWPGSLRPLATDVGGGRLLAGATLEEDPSEEVNNAVVSGILAELAAAAPALGRLRATHAWCCHRPAHPDGLPVIDQVPGLSNAWFTSGHYRTGILVAPAVGWALAEWVSSGARPDTLRSFSVHRAGIAPEPH